MDDVIAESVTTVEADSESEPGPSRWRVWARDAALAVLLALAVGGGLAVYYTDRYTIASGSMEPTLRVGDTYWAVRRYSPPQRGEVVAFTMPDSTGEVLIKRVIGLPGERVEAIDGRLLIDFGELNESVWIDEPVATGDFGPVDLGPDEYFLMGDNRSKSIDSRQFGPVETGSIGYVVRIGGD